MLRYDFIYFRMNVVQLSLVVFAVLVYVVVGEGGPCVG